MTAVVIIREAVRGSAGAELCSGEGFDGGADGDVSAGCRGGVEAGVGPAGRGRDLVADGFGEAGVQGERGGEVLDGGVGVALVFGEDVADDVGSFEADGELPAGAVVPGAGEEGAEGLEHGGGGEVEGSLAAGAVVGDVLYQLGGAADGLPVDAGLVGDDGVALNAGEGGEGDLEQVHGGGASRCRASWRGRRWG